MRQTFNPCVINENTECLYFKVKHKTVSFNWKYKKIDAQPNFESSSPVQALWKCLFSDSVNGNSKKNQISPEQQETA